MYVILAFGPNFSCNVAMTLTKRSYLHLHIETFMLFFPILWSFYCKIRLCVTLLSACTDYKRDSVLPFPEVIFEKTAVVHQK